MIDTAIEAVLKDSAPDTCSLYIHVPFCAFRCDYCDFYSVGGVGRELMQRTLEAIVREARWYRRIFPRTRIRTIYIGGGTPSHLPADLLAAFLSDIAALFWSPTLQEWSLEANPESIDQQKLDIFAAFGVDRLSIGVQSFNGRFLSILDRRTDPDTVRRVLKTCDRDQRFELSVDLMCGLPGQSLVDLELDIAELLSLRPAHISMYSLTVEPDTPLARRVESGRLQMDSQEHRDRLWNRGAALLRDAGYRHYEISNFALSGKPAEHNSSYWQGFPYIGLGPGAVGTLHVHAGGQSGPMPSRCIRIQNPPIGPYCGEKPLHRIEHLEAEQLLLERFLMGLRTDTGVDLARCCEDFQIALPDLVDVLSLWSGRRFLETSRLRAGYAVLSESGRVILDSILPDLSIRLDTLR